MKEELLEKQILKNNKMARIIRTMAIETVEDKNNLDAIFSLSEDIILDPREVVNKEESERFQSSMILDLLVLYNEHSSKIEGVKKQVRKIRHSDEMQTINEEKEEIDEEESNQEI